MMLIRRVENCAIIHRYFIVTGILLVRTVISFSGVGDPTGIQELCSDALDIVWRSYLAAQ